MTGRGQPIAVFGFSRPDKLWQLFDSLAKNPEFASANVYVFIDGPRDDADVPLVEACRNLTTQLARPNWKLLFSQDNKGCRQAIYDGVGRVLSENDAAIVLEDDIIVSPVALAYFNEGLEKYRDVPRVWSICGYAYKSGGNLNNENRSYFLPFSHPWGWATWSSRWRQFDLKEPVLTAAELRSSSFRTRFNVSGLIDAASLLDLEQRGLVSCWDIRWYWRVFASGGVSLFPSRGLTNNTGIGGQGGTHSSWFSPYKILAGHPLDLNHNIPEWPLEIAVDYPALDELISGRESRAHRVVARLGKLRREILFSFRA